MSKKTKSSSAMRKPPAAGSLKKTEAAPKADNRSKKFPILWLLFIAAGTAVCLWPMLGNEFTNWDDEFYVVNNVLLHGPDWKGIFTEPVAANYHPLTMVSLALNYQAGGLHPFSYLLTNLILHLLNVSVVFYFSWLISRKSLWVTIFCTLIFAIHPMHVESVAWVSERKDLLYTLFFFSSLILYWIYMQSGKMKLLIACFLVFLLSLLSKPAAVVLPLVLFLLDYLHGRAFSKKIFLEKIPFLTAAFIMGVLTLKFQSQAMAGLEVYSVGERLLFACYGVMTYFWKFFVPVNLSAFHPFPSAAQFGWQHWLSPLFVAACAVVLWVYRKQRIVVFGLLFFLVNLLLVLQVLSVGQTIISERYTYVAYAGLTFLTAMVLESFFGKNGQAIHWILLAVIVVVFGYQSFQRTQVWKNSGTLWSNVIRQYPSSAVPRTNRANYYLTKANTLSDEALANPLYLKALEDYEAALAADRSNFLAHNGRGRIFIKLNKNNEALADGAAMIRLKPGDAKGYAIRGKAYAGLNKPDEALADFNKGLLLSPSDYNMLYDRGALLFNHFQRYSEALTDFDEAIRLHPQGLYFLTRSFCYYKLGDLRKAKDNAAAAMQMGEILSADYLDLVGLKTAGQ